MVYGFNSALHSKHDDLLKNDFMVIPENNKKKMNKFSYY